MIDFCIVRVVMVVLETNTAWVIKLLKFTKRRWIPNEYIPIEQRFILLLETNNGFRAVTQTYFSSDHHLHGVFGDKQHFSDKDFSI